MKNIILLLLIVFSLKSFSQKDNGIITLLDGTVLSGFVKTSSNGFKFKENLQSKAVKYDFTQVKTATITNKENVETKYEYVYVDYQKKPLLLVVLNEGFLKLYSESNVTMAPVGMGVGGMGGGMGFSSSSTYHIKRQTDKFAQYFVAYGYIAKVSFKNVINDYFTDCPQLQEKVKNKEFKKDDFEKIVQFYNENCAPK